jgi:hypothetical protein
MQAARLTCLTPFDVFVVGCWLQDMDARASEKLWEGAKADLAPKVCIESTGLEGLAQTTTEDQLTGTAAAWETRQTNPKARSHG